MDNEKVADLLFFVGDGFYTVDSFILELQQYGASKRIPLTGVPSGLVSGVSKLLFAHPKAIVQCTSGYLLDLAIEIGGIENFEADMKIVVDDLTDERAEHWTGENLRAFDFVPTSMLLLARSLGKLNASKRHELETKYGIQYHPGVIAYTYFKRVEFVVPDGVEEIPQDYSTTVTPLIDAGIVTPVHVAYAGGEGNPDVVEEE